MQRGASLKMNMLLEGSCWELQVGVNGYEGPLGNSLVTQAAVGRNFEIINISTLERSGPKNSSRIMVRLLEDGYECWLETSAIVGKAYMRDFWQPNILSSNYIKSRIPKVLKWLERASSFPNKYLWGGTIGPNFDCSGLVQAAFSSEGIWLPRDAYQQEKFCTKITCSLNDFRTLFPGDLIFFGTQEICNHVAIYLGKGFYCHSSGLSNGSNGIGINALNEEDPIADYYKNLFRSAGRVEHCYDGTKLI